MKHHIRSKVAFKRRLGRFPSSSQMIQCYIRKLHRRLMKIYKEENVFDKEILPASRNVEPSIA